jgi:hypothetical protein
MQTMPAIGARVRYKSGERECTGIVHAHYPAFDGQETDAAGVTVDEPLPDWWPYDRDPAGRWFRKFAPDIEALELI